YLPDELKDVRIWHPQENPTENKLHERMKQLWKEKYNS
ncbi:Replication-associated recombination protein A, partial [termite gut metagenome]